MARTVGRPRKPGARNAAGRLLPPGPNEKVLAARRALLCASPDADAKVDLSKAENALDLALARGWFSEARHQAARKYASLHRRHSSRVIGTMPGLKVSRAPSSQTSLALTSEENGLPSAGVKTPADFSLAKAILDFEAGTITEAGLRKAEKAHRSAHVDWSRMPDADVSAIFSAALDIENFNPNRIVGGSADRGFIAEGGELDPQASADRSLLQDMWARLTPEQSRELFDICVLESWPQWIIWRTREPTSDLGSWLVWSARSAAWDRKRRLLNEALDVVIERTKGKREPRIIAEYARDKPRSKGAMVTERIEYVDEDGNLLYAVEKRVRVAD